MSNTSTMKPKLKPETLAFERFRIRHEYYKEAMACIGGVHAMAGVGGTGMLLMGIPGVGKSSVLESYIHQYAESRCDLESDTLSKEPILCVSVPSAPTIGSMLRAVLRASRFQVSTGGTVDALREKVDELISNREVQLIIFDEFQHFLREQAQASTRNVVNEIKLLMDRHKLAVVMAGIPQGYRSIAKHEELYQRLAQGQYRLHPFSVKSDTDKHYFASYLASCRKKLDREGVDMIDLRDEIMLQRFFLATKGIPRLIGQLFRNLLEQSDLSQPIALRDFSRTYGTLRLNMDLGTLNPFEAPPKVLAERTLELTKKWRVVDRKLWETKS